ncbi:MAG: hypothetical protein MRY32_08865 [Rickettsiales bacterium]|nr:hypothetical protein [Rickettsiales bacterium]
MAITERLGFIATIWLIGVFMVCGVAAAQTYSTKSKCKNIAYKPDESVEYKADQSVDGWALMPVDAHPPAIDVQDPQIALDLPTGAYVDQDKYNFNFDESRLNVGSIKVEGSNILYNDQKITSYMQDCVE